jgi:teichoic acid glycerol-phosphate primase
LRAATLIYGPHPSHVDHLAPLSQILNSPLFVTDESIYEQCKTFYPQVDSRFCSPLEVSQKLLNDHRAVISCLSLTVIEQLFFFAVHVQGVKLLPIWCPHGNSDKGYQNGFMRLLHEEKAAFIYGPKMLKAFEIAHTKRSDRDYILTGNYRLDHYRSHQAFYDELAQKHIVSKLPQAKKTLLFAPTWNDDEGESAFSPAIETLLKTLPAETNLIVKVHPNTLLHDEDKIDRLCEKYTHNPHILFLNHYPHIYSLLALCDLYIGDFSSIGYDYLSFNKPMVFLNQRNLCLEKDRRAALMQCGIVVYPKDYSRVYSLIDDLLPHDQKLFSSIRKEVYTDTFGSEDEPQKIPAHTEILLEKFSKHWEWF